MIGFILLVFILTGCVTPISTGPDGAIVVTGSVGHSHNDYEQPRPLETALSTGMVGIEVDVFLRDDVLFVAHEERDLDPSRTLRSLYLEPLYRRFRRFEGQIRENGVPVLLFVDFKEPGIEIYEALERDLMTYPGLVRRVVWNADDRCTITPGPVIVVATGSYPRDAIISDTDRVVAIDGRIPDDLLSDFPPHLMPTISTSFAVLGDLPVAQGPGGLGRAMSTIIARSTAAGRLVRFYEGIDSERFWETQVVAGVHLINTDDPERLSAHLRSRR